MRGKKYQEVNMTHVFTTAGYRWRVYYLLLYIDDMLIASKSRSVIDRLKKQLFFEFEMKDLDEAKKVLGMKIKRDRNSGKVRLTQKGY